MEPLDKTPTPLPPFEEPLFVPQALLDLPQWICWRAVWDSIKLKWDKKPICVATGSGTGFTRIEMGATYTEAVAATKRLNLAGVGFVFQTHNRLVGIDLDKCRDPVTGEIEKWARDILDLAETYAEVSPSGTGIHLFALGDLGGLPAVKNVTAGVEMYASGRYFTLTGHHVEGTPLDVNPSPNTVAALKARIVAAPAATGPATASAADQAAAPVAGSADAFTRWAYKRSFFGQVNEAALKETGKWMPELFPSASLEAGTGAWRVKSADLGRPLEEDISVSPSGIVDFGVHDMGDLDEKGRDREGKRTPIDLVREWLPEEWQPPEQGSAVTPVEAALWLCERLGVDPKTLGYRGGGPPGDNSGDKNSYGASAGPDPQPAASDDEDDDQPAEVVVDLFAELTRLGGVHPKKKIILPGLERGFVTLVGGPSGAMKSLWVLQVALAIVAGQAAADKLLDIGKVDYCGSVAVYPYEDATSQLAKRLDGMLRMHGLDHRKFPYKIMARTAQLLSWKNAEQLVLNKAEVTALKAMPDLALIIVDTLTSALLSEETNREFQQVMNLGKRLARRTGATVVIVHHFRKGTSKEEEGATMENMRGGSSLTAAARNVLFVEPPSRKEAGDHGLGDEYMKRTHVKNSNGPRDIVRWYEREVIDIDVVDERNGAREFETAPVLVPFIPNWAATVPVKLQEALAKIVAAETRLGRRVQIVKRDNGEDDIAQAVLGLETRAAKKVIAELERLGQIKRVDALNAQRKPITTIEVINSAPLSAVIDKNGENYLRNSDFAQITPDDQDVENVDDSGI